MAIGAAVITVLPAATDAQTNVLHIPRGRPHLNAARTTFVGDDGQNLRGPYTSTEWTSATSGQNIAAIKSLGFNTVHLYAEDFNTNYPAAGSQAPGYSMANIDAIVNETATNGLYLIITIGNGAFNGDFNLAWDTNFWALYAPRYATNTHVLYEIQNEPVAWGPPYSSGSATPPGGMTLETDCYNIIRANAPNTPVLLFTYAVFGGTGGESAALTDIHDFNTTVFGNANAVWTNEAVGFHGYAGWQQTSIAASNLLSAGYPGIMLEYLGTQWGSGSGILDPQLISQLELLDISWITFEYVPPSGVSVDVTQPPNYSGIVTWAGLGWSPDYGNFPQLRGPYANSGLPWITQDFTNNVLGGSLQIKAANFDSGGQGVAYSVTNTSNATVYRTNATVPLEITSDTGGGYDVTGLAAGEWLEYTIRVTEPALYSLRLRVAGTGGSVQFLAGGITGTNLTGTWTLPSTGGSQTWTTTTNSVFLNPGQQVLHLNILVGGFNLNWLELSPVTSGLIANGTYKILSAANTLAVTGETSNDTIMATSYSGSTYQAWNLLHIGGNLYKITSVANSWSWSANGASDAMGFVSGWSAGGSECFYLQPTAVGYYRFLPVQDGMSVQLSPTNTAVVDEAVINGGVSQQWAVATTNAPVFPTGLSVTATSSNQLTLVWNAVPGATNYIVERSLTSGGAYAAVATDVSTTNYTDTVPVGMYYYYEVIAVAGGVQSPGSLPASVNAPYPWLAQVVGPVGITGNAAYGNGVFTVSGGGADITGTGDAFQFAYLTNSGVCTLIARVTSVADINAWSKAGVMIRQSLATNAANVLMAVTPGEGVTWQYRSSAGGSTTDNNTTGLSAPYWVKLVWSGSAFTGYRSPDGTNWTQQGTATFTLTSPVYIGLAVTSHDSGVLCAATFDNVTMPGWPDAAPPPAPSRLAATAGDGQVVLTWTASSTATSYNLWRSVTNGGPYAIIANVTTTNYADTGVVNGTNYYYVVSALNPAGQGTNSAQVSVTAQNFVPTGLSAVPVSSSQINLTWNAVTNTTSYFVQRSTTNGGPYAVLASGVTATNYNDTGLAAGTTYYYVVSSLNSWGESANSAQASATTVASPMAPAGLAATAVASNQINLVWNLVTNAASYNVKRSLTNGGPCAVIASGVTATNYNDTGLAAATSYYYAVSAVNAAGESPNSAQANATTPTPPPASLVHWCRFSETGGDTVADSVGGPAWTGTLPNGGTLSGGQLALASASQQYVILPVNLVVSLTNITVTAWVNLASLANGNQVFNFGSGTNSYLYLTPRNTSTATVRFGITTNGSGAEQQINCTNKFSVGVWYQAAVTLSGGTGILYVAGAPVGTNSGMTINPSSLGGTVSNYLGKAQSGSVYLNGALEDFRIYNVGLSAADIAAMAVLGPDQMLSANSPQLGLTLTRTNLTVGWPVANPDFTVQACTNLALGGWQNVTSPAPQIVGSNWQVTLPPTTNAMPVFYRLMQ